MHDTKNQLHQDLATCYRLAAHYRTRDLIFTPPGPAHHFLINPYGLLFGEITSYRINPASFGIHSAVYTEQEDTQCMLHTHTRAGCAVVCQAQGVLPLNQFALTSHERIGYHTYEGVPYNSTFGSHHT